MEAYYFRQLDKYGQSVYHAIQEGLTALSPSFPVPRMEGKELSEVLFRLRLDRPELFYVTGFSYRVHPQAASVEFIPQYLFDKGKIREHQRALSARVTKLARPAQSMTDGEKERYVHDFICQNVRYDKLKKPYSHEILGPLGQGVGVCEGMAKSVKALCDALGLWCIVVVSHAAPEQGIRYRHAWNILRLGGSYYHLDATFDRTLSGEGPIRYDYFNLDDRRIFRDHQPLVYPAPSCTDGDAFYYRVQKRSFTRVEEVVRRGEQALRKKQPLLFHWRGGALTRGVLEELLPPLEEAARARSRYVQVRVNWPQAVLHITFPDQPPEQTCTTEEANEGEALAASEPSEA